MASWGTISSWWTSSVARVPSVPTTLDCVLATNDCVAHWLGELGAPTLYASAVLLGGLIRLLTLPLSSYSDRAFARHAAATPALQRAYLQYAEIAEHPRVLREELEFAHAKLLERRRKVLARYETREFAPIVAAAASAGLTVAACTAVTTAVVQAAQSSGGWLAWPLALDPIGALAAALVYWNATQAIRRRMGFSDRTDHRQGQIARVVTVGVPGAAAAVALCSTASFAFTGIPDLALASNGAAASWVAFLRAGAPVMFGAAAVGTLRSAIDRTTLLKQQLRWPLRYPSTHGTYGTWTYSAQAHAQLLKRIVEEVEGAHHKHNYDNAKHNLECECDLRIQQMPIAKKFFRDTRFDKAPEVIHPPNVNKSAFDPSA
jgi:hypothetical protein